MEGFENAFGEQNVIALNLKLDLFCLDSPARVSRQKMFLSDVLQAVASGWMAR